MPVQQLIESDDLKEKILEVLSRNGLDSRCYSKVLDYTISSFETAGRGKDYYGYHNIIHELEVTYVTLVVAQWESLQNYITSEDMKYLYFAALFHDYDSQKNAEKPHEEVAVNFVKTDETLLGLLRDANLDVNIIAALILRTTYPWSGELKEKAEKNIEEYLSLSDLIKNDLTKKEYYKKLGWLLSVVDRISGYSIGNFNHALELANKNAYALSWHPSVLARRSVAYFEDLLNNESEMCDHVLNALPKQMRKLFMDNVLAFMKLREEEIMIKASLVYENVKIVPVIESMNTRWDEEFIKTLRIIHDELPSPYKFKSEEFEESIRDPNTILNTLRLGNDKGPIVGYAKGGPLENYQHRAQNFDKNYGMFNTVFLEPIALKTGYYGSGGGHEIRLLFAIQAEAKGYKFLTSYAQRKLIQKRMERNEGIESVHEFSPDGWDYYRIRL
ncbi:MAG: hypothetical protein ACRD90_04635 [Nitrosopumilaceae archaeon]